MTSLLKIALFVSALVIDSAVANACLNDSSILADGLYQYAGVSQSGGYSSDVRVTLKIESDAATLKRYVTVDGGPERYEIYQCSGPAQPGFPNVYFVRSNTIDKVTDTYKIFELDLEAQGGHPVYSYYSSALVTRRNFSHYSTQGMRLENETGGYFRPGFRVGVPSYDPSGHLRLSYDGSSSPQKLK